MSSPITTETKKTETTTNTKTAPPTASNTETSSSNSKKHKHDTIESTTPTNSANKKAKRVTAVNLGLRSKAIQKSQNPYLKSDLAQQRAKEFGQFATSFGN